MTDMGTSSSDGSADAEREDLEVEEAVRSVVADGYEDRFASAGGGVVRCSSCAAELPLESSALESAHPARDTPTARSGLLVAALRCPRCGTLGHAVLDVDEWTPAEDRAAGGEDRDGATGGLSVNANTHKRLSTPSATTGSTWSSWRMATPEAFATGERWWTPRATTSVSTPGSRSRPTKGP